MITALQLKQEMGFCQTSMLDAMKSLRDEMLALQNKESGVDKTSDSAQAKTNTTLTSDPVPSDHSEVQPMDMEPYGPALPPRSTQKSHSERVVHSDPNSDHSEQASDSEYYQARPKHKKHSDKRKHKSEPIHNLSRLQRKVSPLSTFEGLHNLNLRFLQNLNPRPAQIQSSIRS